MKNAARVRNELSPSMQMLRDSGIGAFVGLVLCIIFSFIAAFAISMGDLPHRIVTPVSMAVIALSALIGSVVSGKIHKRQGLLVGTITGAMMLLIILAAGFFVPDESAASVMIFKAIATILPSLIGSVIGVNLRRKY